jgi:hypothetical protein
VESAIARRLSITPMPKKERCERPGCRARVRFDSPGRWCAKHWKLWWRNGERGKAQPEWMRNPKSRNKPLKCDPNICSDDCPFREGP